MKGLEGGYLIWFSFVTTFFVVLLGSSIPAQMKIEPVPASYKIIEQADSPVKIEYVGIYPPYAGSRMVTYSVTNQGAREIRSIIMQFTRRGRTDSIFLGVPSSPDVIGSVPFMPARVSSQFTFIDKVPLISDKDKVNLESEDSLTLKADYVLFQDGGSWGPDSAGLAETLLGIFEGQKRIAAEAKKLVEAKDEAALRTMILTDGPPADLRYVESESRRQSGIRRGYTAGVILLRSDLLGRGDLSGIPARIRDIEREIGIMTGLDDKRKQISVVWGFGLPIRIAGFTLDDQSLAVDERFSAKGDWLSDLGIKIHNNTGKTIKAFVGSVLIPETRGNGGMLSLSTGYGPDPTISRSTAMDNDPMVPPGMVFEFKMFRERPGTMNLLKIRPGLDGISRAVVSIDQLYFDDGTRWVGYQWQKQDPTDPKRWITLSDQ